MKVTDSEILRAIWRAQVKRTAKGVIVNYIGGGKGLTGDRDIDRHHAQYLSMISRGGLGIELSKGQLARRIKSLVGTGCLQWNGRPGNAYEFKAPAATEMFHFARNWWADRGVPAGFDREQNRMRTIRLSDYEVLVGQLEEELMRLFGDREVTP
ncbi:hypothetical protein J3Q09_17750 [Pseudomonas sp. R4-83]|uniref:hypothetical protein n=1 Tax=unclassified Pseudomonas TaxID=196821 RepID=UPI003DA7BD03